VWSFGVIATELFLGAAPWEGLSSIQIIAALQSGSQPAMPSVESGCPRPLLVLISQCFSATVAARPSFLEILSQLEAMGFDMRWVPQTADRELDDSDKEYWDLLGNSAVSDGRQAFPADGSGVQQVGSEPDSSTGSRGTASQRVYTKFEEAGQDMETPFLNSSTVGTVAAREGDCRTLTDLALQYVHRGSL
jgi:hypothetical protein